MSFIPLAKLLRPHGLAKSGVLSFKAELFSPGGLALQNQNQIFIFRSDTKKYQAYNLSGLPEPLGAKWGENRFVILRFPEDHSPAQGSDVFIKRESFPAIDDKKEVYICDLVGLPVIDEKNESVAKILGYTELGSTPGTATRPRPMNLRLQLFSSGEEIEVPMDWVNWAPWHAGDRKTLSIPDVSTWLHIDQADDGAKDDDVE